MNCPRRHMCWQSKRFYWERAPGWRAGRYPGELLCRMARNLGFCGDGISFLVALANHSNSAFPGGARIAQPRRMLSRGILGSGQTHGVSFWPFPNSSGWWWLISFIFFIRISCHKTAHANSYYGAWPGWAVSISVLPLTNSPTMQGTHVVSLGGKDPLEKEMATHSSILAWEIPKTEESGGLQSMGLQRVRHNLVTK